MKHDFPRKVSIVEVGPRDGLQNEAVILSTEDKIDLVNQLANAGLKRIETGSFVSPRWVPQMADSADVFAGIVRHPGVVYSALTPNLQGLEAAINAKADEVAVFASASESFSRKNINCSISESLARFKPVLAEAKNVGIKVRGYVSCVLGCPYEGYVDPVSVASVTAELISMGCYEVSLGDTTGVGTPLATGNLIEKVTGVVPVNMLAAHFHDTYGQALTNLVIALQHGITTIDSSVAGLGGCPYANGAEGNVATEDVVYMLAGMGIETGVNLEAVIAAGKTISQKLERQPSSRVSREWVSHAV
ncbi:hydroxymethylglutaryl-CoA lyase [Alteromonas aestuariivivens]|uniref:hydroxymethylglutaryl-CoA lyase n=1 Tax=Alteromonas aestuariivivens TaxID=1938339 RepID=A0A3D8MBL6_9ALTE|nr:hydroxymethylglutaryl-CoA lyase [Alteromonas aestuariivivens]RDV27465.1 hydroxymethylglutaryl-CoA lyase [Alteromonas aestuariivivens]